MRKVLLSACIAVVMSLGFLAPSASAQLVVPGASLTIRHTILCDVKAPLEEILLASARSHEDGALMLNVWNSQENSAGEPVCAYMGATGYTYAIGEIDDVVHTLTNSDGSTQSMQIVRVAFQTRAGAATGYIIVLSHMTEAPKVPA